MIGFLWVRAGQAFNTRMVGNLALNLGMPCLIFSTLTRLEVSPEALTGMVGIYAVALGCSLIVGLLVTTFLRLPFHTYLPVFTSANTGNMGLPLCLFAFGQEGLALAIGIFILSSIFSFSVGWSLYAGRLSPDILYNNPLLYAVAAGIPFLLTATRPPAWLTNTTDLVGGLTIPLMLISLGVAIGSIKTRGALVNAAVATIKLCTGFAIGYGLSELFELDGIERGVLIIGCAMPVAVHNYMFAERFDRSPVDIAGMILISTVLSLLTLPLLMLVVL